MVTIVKAGGRVIDKNLDNVVKDLVELGKKEKVVFVHGGGDAVTEMCLRLGVEPKFVVSPEGIRSRYTDARELEVYVMVMAGKLNKTIVSKMVALGAAAVGLSGADGSMLLAERKKRIVIVDERGRKRVIEGGYTGRITRVNVDLLSSLLSLGYVVVVSPIAVDAEGVLLNVDGDQAAYAIATSLKADRLLFLTDVEGVIVDGVLIREMKCNEVEGILERIGAGMNRKLMLAAKAVEEGVGEAIISSGLLERPISEALQGRGSVVRRA